jgi:hypothetical protein
MTSVLKMAGAVWFAIGAWGSGTLLWPGPSVWTESGGMSTAVGLISNFILFVVPGLTLCGVAALRGRRQSAATAQTDESPPTPVAAHERLKRLRELKARGLITEGEYAARHSEIVVRI